MRTSKPILITLALAAVLLAAFAVAKRPAVAPVAEPSAPGAPSEEVPAEEPASVDNGNADEKADLIIAFTPQPGDLVSSPLAVTGEARGYWFFEASFPVRLYDANGVEIAVGIAEAQSEWMTVDFVPFVATLVFAPPATATGKLVLERDNPSGLPEHDDALIVPVVF